MKFTNRISGGAIAALTLIFTAALTTALPAHAQTEHVIYYFCALTSCADGSQPSSNLIADSQGNMYGTTTTGGTGGEGEVFKLSPGGTMTGLYSFCPSGGNLCPDGTKPIAGLVRDSAGNLYGTTFEGGAHGLAPGGTVFKLSPDGTLRILHSFSNQGGDGYGPDTPLAMDAAGNLYGTTNQGGAYNNGVVYRITPTGRETILHSFGASPTDGTQCYAGLAIDSNGNFFGTTGYGGTHDAGTVFKISAGGSYSVLYNFGAAQTASITPEAGLVVDSQGNLYGTAVYGGQNHIGTVFRISPIGAEKVLYSFQINGTDGYNPTLPLIRDASGNLYGETYTGGILKNCPNGCGTVFEVSPSGVETVLHDFSDGVVGGADGSGPVGGLVMDSEGHLFGMTYYGGNGNLGTVFVVTP